MYTDTCSSDKQFARNHMGTKGRGESPRIESTEEGREVNSGEQGKRGGRETGMRGNQGALNLSQCAGPIFMTYSLPEPQGTLQRLKTRRMSTWEMRANVQEAVVRVLLGRTH